MNTCTCFIRSCIGIYVLHCEGEPYAFLVQHVDGWLDYCQGFLPGGII